MTLKNNRAPLLSFIKLYASFDHHMWIQTGVTVRKQLSWVVTLTFYLRPWPLAWTLPWSLVITPEYFMMIRWWEHSQKGMTDGHMDRRSENTIHRAAWSKIETGDPPHPPPHPPPPPHPHPPTPTPTPPPPTPTPPHPTPHTHTERSHFLSKLR